MTLTSRRWLRASALTLTLLLPALSAGAQQPQPLPSAPAAKAASSGEAGLRQRVEQLEEQLVDMQVVIGTLESLARGGAPVPAAAGGGRPQPGPAAAYGAAEAGRLDSIETQIRALGAQMEQLQEQLRALASRSGSAPPSTSVAAAEPPGPPVRPNLRPQVDLPQTERSGFGSVTVSPDTGRGDQIDRVLSAPQPGAAEAPPATQTASAPPAAEPELTAKQLYEQAYGFLLQRDYGAAEAAFEEFLKRHGTDPLAGNAQYWLGESLYVRGQYRAAAGAFLKGYQTYARSPKAPESLLKLAMSLQRLGQKDAACSSYSELTTKFPAAPAHVKNAAQSEKQKAGC